ncbi:MAG: hypothetical protein ACYCYL_07305 [Acidithiobacillus sp.]
MPITNPIKVLLFTNRPESVNRIRQTVAANPSAPVWWTLIFVTVIAFSAIPLQHLIQPKAHVVFGWAYLVASAMLMVVEALSILFKNGMATWAVNRQQRKSWGVPIPDESRILWFRPGIWVGAATSYAVGIAMIILEVCVAWLLPAWHKQIASTSGTVIGVMSLLYFSYAISYFYGIPKRLFVFRYVLLPVVLVSIIGIVAAIIMGQARNYETQKAQHEVSHSVDAPATTISPAQSPAPSSAVRRSAIDRPATHSTPATSEVPLMQSPRVGGYPLLSSMIRKDDTHCLAGLPLAAPWWSPGPSISATVVQFVSRMDVLRDIAWNNRALHGMIAPRYLRNQRVLLHPDGSRAGVPMLAVVPTGMRVTIGERVRMDSFHAFHRVPCTYVPNLIEKVAAVTR